VLNIVGQALEELGLAAPGAPLRYYINITAGESLAISVFAEDGRFFQVKASEFLDLASQYATYCRAWADYPSFVPRPLGYRQLEGWSLMVTEGRHHVAVRPERLLDVAASGPDSAAHQLLGYFRANAGHAGPSASEGGHAGALAMLAAYFAPTPLARTAAAVLQSAGALGVEALPDMPQHGDFTLNNLAWSSGRLVIFDWEDFRRVRLPGFDLFALCFTVLEQHDFAMRGLMQGRRHRRLDPLLERACAAQGLAPERFRRLVPLYLLSFLHLKRNYGAELQQRLADMLVALTEPAAAVPAALPPYSAALR